MICSSDIQPGSTVVISSRFPYRGTRSHAWTFNTERQGPLQVVELSIKLLNWIDCFYLQSDLGSEQGIGGLDAGIGIRYSFLAGILRPESALP